MTPQVSATRPGSTHQSSTGIISHPSSRAEGSDSRQLRPQQQDENNIRVKVQRHGQWALLSQVQSQLSRIQGTERSVINSYRELLSLSRELERTNSKSQELASKARQLSQKLKQEGLLDGNLQPRQTPGRESYILDRVDLLSPRPQQEQLAVRLPNGGMLSLQLSAGTSPDHALSQLSSQLKEHGIQASTNNQGQLRLTGPQNLLAAPWVFQGQGVRVPGGNPVPIQLAPEQDQLSQLANGLENGQVAQEKQRIRALLATLEQQRRELENQRQALLRQVAQLRASEKTDPSQQSDLSSALKKTLQEGDFTLQLNALMAQATLSRFSVEALLGR